MIIETNIIGAEGNGATLQGVKLTKPTQFVK